MEKWDEGYSIHNGRFDMDVLMKRFTEVFSNIYGADDLKYVEVYGR